MLLNEPYVRKNYISCEGGLEDSGRNKIWGTGWGRANTIAAGSLAGAATAADLAPLKGSDRHPTSASPASARLPPGWRQALKAGEIHLKKLASMLHREHVCKEIGNPLLALLRDSKVA